MWASYNCFRTVSVLDKWHTAIVLQTSARLLQLLGLLQTRRAWSGPELASRLDVTGRTLRRDVDRVRSLGYPVRSTGGIGGGYQLGVGASLPPLLFRDDEAVAIAIGLRVAARGTISNLEEASTRALAKLEQVLPTRLQRRVAALHEAILPMQARAPVLASGTLTTIASSCYEHKRLAFHYRAYKGAASKRLVEPHRLVHTGRLWYLVAWDTGRKDWRTFRVDRMSALSTTRAQFVPQPPPSDNIEAYVSRGVSTGPYPFRARLRLHASPAEAAMRIPPESGFIEAVDPQRCILHFGSRSLDELAAWTSMLGFTFEILDPPELEGAVRALALRLDQVIKSWPKAADSAPVEGLNSSA